MKRLRQLGQCARIKRCVSSASKIHSWGGKTLDESEQVESLTGDEFVKKQELFAKSAKLVFSQTKKIVAKFKFEVFSSFASKILFRLRLN